jgi:hypothetical protein
MLKPSVTIQDLQSSKFNKEPNAIMKQCQIRLMKEQRKNTTQYICLEK